MRSFSKPLIGFFAAVSGAAAILLLSHFTLWGQDPGPAIHVDTTSINRSTQPFASYAPVVKKAAPSVVNIFSTTIVHMRQRYWNPFNNDPFFRQFFGDQLGQGGSREITRREESLGSGVIVSPDGYILTANHVVDGADKIRVAIPGDKKEYTARVVGTDPPTDVAVLKIDAHDLPAVTLGDSDQLEVGDIVLAIGDPFQVGQTVTMGIVSGLGRQELPFGQVNKYQDFIQTDAAINPGNSGGALVDTEGRLVGINTAIIPNDNGGNQGIGFAVPVNLARHVMERLIHGGKVTRGYLGIKLEDITAGLAESFGLTAQNGALVDDVYPGTPAQKAGIESGDVIVEFNGKDVADASSLQLMISDCSPEAEAAVKVIRNGHEKTFTVKLAELPGHIGQNENSKNNRSVNSTPDALDGVTVLDLDQQTRQELKIPDSIQGALVTDVGPDSNSAEAGLQQGDVVVEINHQPVNNAEAAVKLYTQARGDRILLRVWRRSGDYAGTTYLSVNNTKEP
ncbi:MAG: DegQ family serine endoprotease [Verrucomicrobiia bacterium]